MTKVKLKNSLMLDEKELREIELRRPKVRDRLAVERSKSSDAEKEVQLIANLSELPIEVIEEMDLSIMPRFNRNYQIFYRNKS